MLDSGKRKKPVFTGITRGVGGFGFVVVLLIVAVAVDFQQAVVL